MKKFLVLIALAAMATTAFAQVDEDPDGVGIYFDATGETLCNPGPPGFISAYLLITNPSGADMVGFEGEVVIETDFTTFQFEGWTITGTNAASAPEFFMAWATPVEKTGNVLQVASYGAFPNSAGTYMKFFLKPYVVPSVPGKLAYIESAAVGTKIPLQIPTGDYLLPVATLGLPCEVVDNEDMSWGGVKSLF